MKLIERIYSDYVGSTDKAIELLNQMTVDTFRLDFTRFAEYVVSNKLSSGICSYIIERGNGDDRFNDNCKNDILRKMKEDCNMSIYITYTLNSYLQELSNELGIFKVFTISQLALLYVDNKSKDIKNVPTQNRLDLFKEKCIKSLETRRTFFKETFIDYDKPTRAKLIKEITENYEECVGNLFIYLDELTVDNFESKINDVNIYTFNNSIDSGICKYINNWTDWEKDKYYSGILAALQNDIADKVNELYPFSVYLNVTYISVWNSLIGSITPKPVTSNVRFYDCTTLYLNYKEDGVINFKWEHKPNQEQIDTFREKLKDIYNERIEFLTKHILK